MILTKEVTLNPGESRRADFTLTPTQIKTYTVQGMGLMGWFEVIALPPEFVVSDLVITPSTVYVGDPVTISVLVTNTGGSIGTATITLEVT